MIFLVGVYGQRVGAPIDDCGDAVPKTQANLLQLFRSSAVFYGVVQNRGNCFVFIRAVLQDEPCDRQKMTHVRYFGALTPLLAMEFVSVREGVAKSFG